MADRSCELEREFVAPTQITESLWAVPLATGKIICNGQITYYRRYVYVTNLTPYNLETSKVDFYLAGWSIHKELLLRKI